MKALVIAIILGGLGYYMFMYDSNSLVQKQSGTQDVEKTEEQKILDEMGIENKSYDAAITDTYNKYKKRINDAKTAIANTEKRYQIDN